MSDEQQIAALREEIRRAGHLTGETRRKVLCVSLVFLFVAVAWLFQPVSNPPRAQISLHLVAGALVVAVGPATLLALLVSEVYYLVRRAQLRQLLRHLPQSFRADVLLPLRREERGDTGRLADALLRGFDVAGELTPADVPKGRGDEVADA